MEFVEMDMPLSWVLGPVGALVLALIVVYALWKMNSGMTKHQRSTDSFIRETLLEALNNNTESNTALVGEMKDLAQELRRRPCVAGQDNLFDGGR